ncbi:nuclear transport factor 2 family protein [Rouxiella sp. WC2420]|uniref:Nuclear transport factor 2 family protein n=1 Tax=Rouxiella sp. WC2420 TaxID=3234145 RepID=A0AB39VMK7_9GAMM
MINTSPDYSSETPTAHLATLEGLKAFYRNMDSASLSQLPDIYHSQTVLVDPVGRHEGLPALKHYFEQLLAQTEYCRFDIQQTLTQDDEAVLFWRMTYAHPRLRKGQELTLDGTSHLRFSENRVIYQRDFYDMGAMLYEHIPLLGSVVRAVKSRLAP